VNFNYGNKEEEWKKIIDWLSPMNFFLQQADIFSCRRRELVDGCLQILSLKNGNLVLEAPFGAMEFICDSCLNMLPD
jgi:hypothetical protein